MIKIIFSGLLIILMTSCAAPPKILSCSYSGEPRWAEQKIAIKFYIDARFPIDKIDSLYIAVSKWNSIIGTPSIQIIPTNEIFDKKLDGINVILMEPEVNSLAYTRINISNDVIVDTDIVFNDNMDDYDVESVALHEFGHAVGLPHNNDVNSVMYPYLAQDTTKRQLTFKDVENVLCLYK